MGAELFERSNGGTRPTRVGQEFLEAAQRIVDETDSSLRRVKTRYRGESGELRIGVCTSLSTGNLRSTLIEHRRRFEGVEVHTIEGGRERLLGDVTAGAIDIAITTNSRSTWNYRKLPLWSERAIVALPEQHPLSDHPVIKWQELSCDRILLTQRGVDPDLEQVLAAKLTCSGHPRILYQDVGFDRLLALVGAGYGVLPVLEGAAGIACAGVVYRELHDDNGPTQLHFAAYWREPSGNATLKPFVDLLLDRYPDLSIPSVPG